MQPDVRWAHQIRLDPVTGSVPAAQDFVCRHLIENRLLYLLDDIDSVVSELVSLAVLHAQTPVVVTIEEIPFCVTLSVDGGSPFGRVAARVRPDDPSGRGLRQIGQRSSAWGFSPAPGHETTVWAMFAVRPVVMTSASVNESGSAAEDAAPPQR